MDKATAYYQVLQNRAAAMQANPTPSEKTLYRKLENARIEFWQQIVIGFYIADIVLPSRMLIVEVDGNHHKQSKNRKKDTKRTKWLNKLGFKVARVSNKNVETLDLQRITKFPHIGSIGECKRSIAKAHRIRDKAVTSDKFVPSEFYFENRTAQAIFAAPTIDETEQEMELALFYDRT